MGGNTLTFFVLTIFFFRLLYRFGRQSLTAIEKLVADNPDPVKGAHLDRAICSHLYILESILKWAGHLLPNPSDKIDTWQGKDGEERKRIWIDNSCIPEV